MRTWTSGRDGPPAQDTSIPPPTVGKACLPPSPVHLIIITVQVRQREPQRETEKRDNVVTSHLRAAGTIYTFHSSMATLVTSGPDCVPKMGM